MEKLDRGGEVDDRLDGADPRRERDAGVPADSAGLVLEVELDCVDPALVDQVEDPLPQGRVGPGVEGDVHRADRVRRRARLHRDPDATGGRVPERVRGDERHRPLRARRPRDLKAAVLDEYGLAVGGQARPPLERAGDPDRLARWDQHPRRIERNRRARRIDGEAPVLRRARAWEASRGGRLEVMRPLAQRAAVEDEPALRRKGAARHVGAVQLPAHTVEDALVSPD